MRDLFRALESWEQKHARNLDLDWTDGRLGLIRRKALDNFLPLAGQAFLSGPAEAVTIYAQAYREALRELGFKDLLDPARETDDA